ncbi:MAG: hypothetical protein KF883_01335 [Thermomicrobiales bacterium]|nr:hypothetical protein [Thermomicrobiales bacterium]
MASRDNGMDHRKTSVSRPLTRRELGRRAALAGLTIPGAASLGGMMALAPQRTSAQTAGGSSVWAAESDPVSLDPIVDSGFAATQAFEHSYESLTGYDSNLNIVPALAESWETPDDLTYIFHLRQGVKFHDGSDFTAEDVKYTFDFVIDQDGPAGWRVNFSQVESVEIIDSHTVQFNNNSPFPGLLGAMAILRSSMVVKQGAFETPEVLATSINGTGPYKLVEYVPKDYILYQRNPDYWGNPLPYLDEVTFKILEDEETRIAGLRGGSLDYAALSTDGMLRMEGDSAFTINSAPRSYLYILQLNPRRPHWYHPSVRKAISIAINREEISDKVFSGGLHMSGPIPAGFGDWALPEDEIAAAYSNDLDEARALLAEGGIEEGTELDFVVTAFNQFFPGLAVVVADQLSRVGINVNIRQLETGVFITETSEEGGFNFDMQPNAFSPRHDPDGFVFRFHSDIMMAGSETTLGSDELDDLLVKGRTTIDPALRKEYYDAAQRILLELAPMTWIGNDSVIEAVRTNIQDYTQSPFSRRDWGLKHAWIASE